MDFTNLTPYLLFLTTLVINFGATYFVLNNKVVTLIAEIKAIEKRVADIEAVKSEEVLAKVEVRLDQIEDNLLDIKKYIFESRSNN